MITQKVGSMPYILRMSKPHKNQNQIVMNELEVQLETAAPAAHENQEVQAQKKRNTSPLTSPRARQFLYEIIVSGGITDAAITTLPKAKLDMLRALIKANFLQVVSDGENGSRAVPTDYLYRKLLRLDRPIGKRGRKPKSSAVITLAELAAQVD